MPLHKPRLFAIGDINAFFGLMLDNLSDLLYSWMAWRLARASGRDDVTAMPLGLDTPSTFG